MAMKNEDFVRHFIAAEKECDEVVLRQVMNFMDDVSADAILEENSDPWSRNYSYLEWKRNNKKPLDRSFHKNETIKRLLTWYLDPKSKKVDYARKTLCERFPYLSYEEQCKIIDTFMHRGYVHDTVYCCRYLVEDEYWKEEYREMVERFFLNTLTGNTRNSYAAAKVVAHHSSQEFIRECIEMLDDEDMDENSDLYDVLQVLVIACEGHPYKILKHAKLTPDRYAYVMVKKGLRISEEEACEALEKVLSENYVSKSEVRIMSWVVAQMGYLDMLLDFGVRMKKSK